MLLRRVYCGPSWPSWPFRFRSRSISPVYVDGLKFNCFMGIARCGRRPPRFEVPVFTSTHRSGEIPSGDAHQGLSAKVPFPQGQPPHLKNLGDSSTPNQARENLPDFKTHHLLRSCLRKLDKLMIHSCPVTHSINNRQIK